MANKMCDLCQNAYAKDMRFGVNLCEACLAEYTAAVHGDADAYARLVDPHCYPNATKSALENLIYALKRPRTQPAAADERRGDSTKRKVPAYPVAEPQEEGMLASMYDNIGGKIKGVAKFAFVLGSIAAVILGLSMLGSDAVSGVMAIFLGPLVAWISSWTMYALGELVEKTAANERNTRGILKLMMEERKE